MSRHRVWAEIDLDALDHNLFAIRRAAGAGVRVMLVVKADAYGHGAVQIARHAVRCGVAALGVSTSAEALELRESGLELPILILGTVIEDEVADCLRHGVHVGLHASDRRASLEELAGRLNVRADVHVNIDTGMGQLGLPPERALDLLAEVQASPHLRLSGVMSHIAATDGLASEPGRAQRDRFAEVVRTARAAGLLNGWVHLANSATIFTSCGDVHDTVRPGIAAYGSLPPSFEAASTLRPVLSLKSQVVYLRDVPAGTSVGYASEWRAPEATRLATLPVGYNDGLPWGWARGGEVLVGGRRAPIVGRVSMDYVTIDVGHVSGLAVGDVATLIGRDGDEEIRLEEIASRVGTIPYEVACSVGTRVARLPKGGSSVSLPGQEAAPSPDPDPAASRRETAAEPGLRESGRSG